MWIANSFVIGATTVLFLLWFRYVCSLLLAAQRSLECSEAVARANSLAFADVLRSLEPAAGKIPSREYLDAFVIALERDFEVVTYLVRHMGESPLAAPAEAMMLRIDYRFQSLWYKVVRYVSAERAARRVNQMALIISHFADLIAERSVSPRVSPL